MKPGPPAKAGPAPPAEADGNCSDQVIIGSDMVPPSSDFFGSIFSVVGPEGRAFDRRYSSDGSTDCGLRCVACFESPSSSWTAREP